MKHILVIMTLVMGLPFGVQAQTITTSKIIASGGNLELDGLPTSGGDHFIFMNSSTERIIHRALVRADIPSPLAYEDEANTFSQAQVFTNLISSQSTAPAFYFKDTSNAVDQTLSRLNYDALNTCVQFVNDAISTILSSPLCAENAGSVILAPASRYVLPAAPHDGFIGSPLKPWLGIWADELNVATLVAQDIMASIGGRILVAPTTYLLEGIISGTGAIKVKHNNLASGDRVYLERDGRIEFMAITSGPTRINLIQNFADADGTSFWASSLSSISNNQQTRWQGNSSIQVSAVSNSDLYNQTSGQFPNSTAIVISLYIRRVDGAAIVPSGSAYRILCDSQTVNADGIEKVDDVWYRIWGHCTTNATAGDDKAGVTLLPNVIHFIDTIQAEAGSVKTPWSETSASYSVTRDLDGSGANAWDAGDAVVNTGTTGSGFIDIYSMRGVKAGTEFGPTIAGNVRNSSTYNDWSPRWAVGNLNGLYGYSSTIYGVAMGNPSGTYMTIEPTNGIRLIGAGVTKFQIDGSGNASFASGNTVIDGSSTRVTARNSALFAAANGYNFTPLTVTGGEFGIFGFDTGTSLARGINIRNVHSTSGAQAQFQLDLGNNGAGNLVFTMVSGSAGVLGTVDFSGVSAFNINGTAGLTTTLTCGAGQAVKNLTTLRGFVTAASCGAP